MSWLMRKWVRNNFFWQWDSQFFHISLVSDTSNICHLSDFSTDEFESRIIILPSIFFDGIDSIGSIHTTSTIACSEMKDDITESIDIFFGWCPIWSDDIDARFYHDISIRVTVGAISSIFWESEEWCESDTVELRIVDRCLIVSTGWDTISSSTRTNRPSPILSFHLSLKWESLIPSIVGEKWGGLIPCKEPPRLFRWTLRSGGSIASCPDLTSDDDISTTTSRICESLLGKKKWWQSENESEIFSHREWYS